MQSIDNFDDHIEKIKNDMKSRGEWGKFWPLSSAYCGYNISLANMMFPMRGGVLEHPAFTKAFEAHGITRPSGRGWQRADCGGWVCRVDQGNYGHIAKKATWLYAYGAKDLPELVWDSVPDRHSQALVSWCGNKTDRFYDRPRVSKKAASATPLAFREVLMHIARSSRGRS
jgi:hypothetical protein